jgi:hypothetical protein
MVQLGETVSWRRDPFGRSQGRLAGRPGLGVGRPVVAAVPRRVGIGG